MRDVENHVYTLVKDKIKDLCPNTSITYQSTIPNFPFMYFKQKDNPAISYDLDGKENGVKPMIEIHVYTNGTLALDSNKKIFVLIDAEMISLGFQRMYGPTEIVGLSDSKITEQLARYTRVVCDGDIL